MIINVDLKFNLLDNNDKEISTITKKLGKNGQKIVVKVPVLAADFFAQEVKRYIKNRREAGEERLADAWEDAVLQLEKNKTANLTKEQHDYVKKFLTDDVVSFFPKVKAQLLNCFQ